MDMEFRGIAVLSYIQELIKVLCRTIMTGDAVRQPQSCFWGFLIDSEQGEH